MFGLCEGEESAKRVGEAIAGVFSKGGLENQLYVSRVNQTGVKVIGRFSNAPKIL